jgi:hypothetical protein
MPSQLYIDACELHNIVIKGSTVTCDCTVTEYNCVDVVHWCLLILQLFFVWFLFFSLSHHTPKPNASVIIIMRFLHLIRPVMCVLPEVASPDRKVRKGKGDGIGWSVGKSTPDPTNDPRLFLFFFIGILWVLIVLVLLWEWDGGRERERERERERGLQ